MVQIAGQAIYNDRITARSRYGTIRRLGGFKSGIVSPIYKCFRLHNEDAAAYYDFYFQTGKHDEEIRALVNEGARAGRYNLTINQFLSTRVPRVGADERRQVANCLESLDNLIAAETEKLEALKRHKKGLLQQLFPAEGETIPCLRFPRFRSSKPWQTALLSDVSIVVRGGSPRPIDDFITKDSAGLNWLKIGDVDSEAKYITRTSQKVLKSALSKTRTISPGDLILSNSMSFGRPYLSEIHSCIHDGWLAVTKLNANLLSEFTYYWPARQFVPLR